MFVRNFPLANITALGVGGSADFFVCPRNVEEIISAQRFALNRGYPLTVIGCGTNLLVRAGGVRGVVLQLAAPFAHSFIEGTILEAGAGCLFSSLSKAAWHHGLSGLEFAVGIPGSLGGAVFMNAGAYEGEIGPLVRQVRYVAHGQPGIWSQEDFSYSYRYSRLQDEKGAIVTAVALELKPEEKHLILAKMNDLQNRRREKQPLDLPSAGSTFKRPAGHFVGPLIEKAGLKGFRIGGAEVSRKHAGFLIKVGTAQSRDFLDLISHVQTVVQEQFGVFLEPEIRIIGEE